ncbi:MAG: Multicopper oxidase [uncultured Thermomicrobiales bacterium]|uniref:Multicopper oxidase n=1 Tax=uncultured Thermomicrobiales bacterium TaxID=1645740 RepID=A0A6J4TTF7_9BACT|nr:MAG: Multicopper oxidase [uncultured Thermomicrobiales bacterium]
MPLTREDLVANILSAPARRRFGRRRLAFVALTPLALTLALLGAGLLRNGGAGAETAAQLREFTLTASEIDWEVAPGQTVKAWAYNGQVPGPEIRVREGDTVRITLKNQLPTGTTVHWHGMDVPPAMDGPAGLNQAPVEPGGEFVYEFVATNGGSRMYHSHTDVATQVGLGLYGPMIVEPKDPERTYDREATYMIGEWDLELTPDVALGKAPAGPGDAMLRGGELGADLFLMNGRAGDAIAPMPIAEGERALIRVMNIGNMPHPIHTHGHSFKIVATDGNPVPEGLELVKDTVLIGPGERYDLEIVADNPGIWMFHCHIESHAANGMMTTINYVGETPSGPAADAWTAAGFAPGAAHASHGAPAAVASPTAAPAATATAPAPPATTAPPTAPPAEGKADWSATENGVVVRMLDDRFETPAITIAAGTTVTWVNEGRHAHRVAAFDTSFSSVRLGPGESYSYTFATAGEFSYVCSFHTRAGMLGKITVE